MHDSQMFEVLLDAHPPKGHEVSADSAHRLKERLSGLRKKGFKPRITYKAKRGQPLRSRQRALTPSYSKVRCRVEHVFGAMRNDRRARYMTCLGLNRSRVWLEQSVLYHQEGVLSGAYYRSSIGRIMS